jgi:nitrogen fixation protein NifU and related proteins
MLAEKLLDHFRNPRHVGELPPPAVTVEVSNPVCGDIFRLSARFENGRIAEAAYRTRGCTASIATGSAVTEWLTGRTAVEAARLTAEEIEEAVGGLAAESRHAARLCLDGVKVLLKTAGDPQ